MKTQYLLRCVGACGMTFEKWPSGEHYYPPWPKCPKVTVLPCYVENAFKKWSAAAIFLMVVSRTRVRYRDVDDHGEEDRPHPNASLRLRIALSRQIRHCQSMIVFAIDEAEDFLHSIIHQVCSYQRQLYSSARRVISEQLVELLFQFVIARTHAPPQDGAVVNVNQVAFIDDSPLYEFLNGFREQFVNNTDWLIENYVIAGINTTEQVNHILVATVAEALRSGVGYIANESISRLIAFGDSRDPRPLPSGDAPLQLYDYVPEEFAGPVISLIRMSTSFASSLPVVSGGHVSIKGVKSKRNFGSSLEDRVGPSNTLTASYAGVITSNEHKKKFAFLDPFQVTSATPLRESNNKSSLRGPSTAQDVLCLLNIADQDDYTKMPGFNNIWMQEMIINKTGPSVTDNTDWDWTTHTTTSTDARNLFTIEDPTYSIFAVKGLIQPGAPTAGVLFESQNLHFKFKNLTHATSNGLASHTPLYVTIYCCKFIEPMHLLWNAGDVGNDPVLSTKAPLTESLEAGFYKNYAQQIIHSDGETASLGAQGQLSQSADQGLDIGLQDNAMFDENLTVVSKKAFVLCAGQELNLDYSLKNNQFMSFAYRDKAVPMYQKQNPGSGNDDNFYNPMIHRKGEYCFMVAFHGGLYGTSTTAGTTPEHATIEPACLGWYCTQRVRYRMIRPYSTKSRYFDSVIETNSLAAEADIDIGEAS